MTDTAFWSLFACIDHTYHRPYILARLGGAYLNDAIKKSLAGLVRSIKRARARRSQSI